MTITPKLVRQNRNTTIAAAATAGATPGSTTRRAAPDGRRRPAGGPRAPGRGRPRPSAAPTVRSTTARLKQRCAARIAHHVPRASTRPRGPSNEANAAPITTVGSTNGTVATVRRSARPRNGTACSTQARAGRSPGSARTTPPPARRSRRAGARCAATTGSGRPPPGRHEPSGRTVRQQHRRDRHGDQHEPTTATSGADPATRPSTRRRRSRPGRRGHSICSRHASIQRVTPLVDRRRARAPSGPAARGAHRVELLRAARRRATGNTKLVSGSSACHSVAEHELDQLTRRARAASVPRSTPAYSTWAVQLSSITVDAGSVTRALAEDHLDGRARGVRQHDRPVAARHRVVGVVRVVPAGPHPHAVGLEPLPSSPASRPRRSGRRCRSGTRARATRSPGSRTHEQVPVGRVGQLLERGRRREVLCRRTTTVHVHADVAGVDRHQPVAAVALEPVLLGHGVERRRARTGRAGPRTAPASPRCRRCRRSRRPRGRPRSAGRRSASAPLSPVATTSIVAPVRSLELGRSGLGQREGVVGDAASPCRSSRRARPDESSPPPQADSSRRHDAAASHRAIGPRRRLVDLMCCSSSGTTTTTQPLVDGHLGDLGHHLVRHTATGAGLQPLAVQRPPQTFGAHAVGGAVDRQDRHDRCPTAASMRDTVVHRHHQRAPPSQARRPQRSEPRGAQRQQHRRPGGPSDRRRQPITIDRVDAVGEQQRRAPAPGRWRPCRPDDAGPRRRAPRRRRAATGSTESMSPTTRSTCQPWRSARCRPGVDRDHRSARTTDQRPGARPASACT